MWLMTKYGFYSIVRKAPETYHVRSREMKDLENLMQHVSLHDVRILDTMGCNYAARVILDSRQILAVMKFLGENIDYDHFAGMIEATTDQAHKPYDRIGNILACSLGAYGRRGKCT